MNYGLGSDSDSDNPESYISWTSPTAPTVLRNASSRAGQDVDLSRRDRDLPSTHATGSASSRATDPLVGQTLARQLQNLRIDSRSRSRYDDTLVISDNGDNYSVSEDDDDSSGELSTPRPQTVSSTAQRRNVQQAVARPSHRHSLLPSISNPGRLSTSISTRSAPATTPERIPSTVPLVHSVSAPPQTNNFVRPAFASSFFYRPPPTATPLIRLFDTMDLSPYIIAHDKGLQKCLDEAFVAWGTQYEIYRGLQGQQWDIEGVTARISALSLKGHPDDLAPTNERTMPFVQRTITGHCRGNPGMVKIAQEMDREQEALRERNGRGLGLMGPFKASDPEKDWYGGQVQQIVRLVQANNAHGFELLLEPMEMRRSSRLARFYTSRRILYVRIGQQLLWEKRQQLMTFLKHKFVLAGRVFIPIPPKDDGLYMVEVKEDFERVGNFKCCDHFRFSYGELLEWHNPLELNSRQPMVKYHTRFALALSTSVPVIEFNEENILYISDIVTSDWGKDSKDAPAEKTLTDGCGFINQAALTIIAKRYKIALPAAIQGRIAGAKGLWILKPDDDDPAPKIWIRDSQNKIKYRSLDRSHRILDLVQVAHPVNVSARHQLSMQSIINLSWNGVPNDVFTRLQQEGLDITVQPLLEWNGEKGMARLWRAIERQGGVSASRMARNAAGLSRLLGWSGREFGNLFEEADNTTDNDAETYRTLSQTYTGMDESSGAPHSLYESALQFVQAGFRPDRFKPLHSKMEWILKEATSSAIKDFKIPLPDGQSIEAFVIPDPIGILKENEVSFTSSQPMLNNETMVQFHTVVGDVLIGRFPIRLPSDIQKVCAVDYAQLHPWKDVIIVPTVGSSSYCRPGGQRTLMSILSGGDVDGDTLFMIWAPDLVQPFKNSQLILPPDDFKDTNFERRVETVEQFMSAVSAKDRCGGQLAFQEILLSGLSDGKVGTYSYFHDSAVWHSGYDSPKTIRLAYMSNALLDSSKTGLRLRAKIVDQDWRACRGRPICMDQNTRAEAKYQRCHARGPSVLQDIYDAGEELQAQIMNKFKAAVTFSNDIWPRDIDLVRPFETLDAGALSVLEREDLDVIQRHVDKAHRLFLKIAENVRTQRQSGSANRKKSRKPGSGARKVDDMLPVISLYHKPLEPPLKKLKSHEVIMASYAYGKSENFGVTVAFRLLCRIKADSLSQAGAVPTIPLINEFLSMSSGAGRLLDEYSELVA